MEKVTAEHRASFIQTVVEDPHDTSVRLIFADWLQENGEEDYASFIRVQVELADLRAIQQANMSFSDPDVLLRIATLCCRERELMAVHNGRDYEWFSPRGELLGEWHWEFRRGFVECVQCHCTHWLRHGPLIVRAQPITEVQLTDPQSFNGVFIQNGVLKKYPDPLTWARGPHPALGLEALPSLKEDS